MGIKDKLVKFSKALHLDGWANDNTGLGTTRDKATTMLFFADRLLGDWELEAMYHGDDMVATIVDAVVDDGLRKGYGIEIQQDENDKSDPADRKMMEKAIKMDMDRLNTIERLGEGAAWGRLFGGAAVWPQVDAPGALDEELDMNQIRSLKSFLVLDRRDLTPIVWDVDPMSPTFGWPLIYQLGQVGTGAATTTARVHASRIITFGGQRTTWRRRLLNNGWSTSVMHRPFQVLQMFHTAWQSVGHLMTDSAQGVYAIKDLISMLGSKERDRLEERMRVIEMGKSVVRGILIDSEDESYERKQTSMAGFAPVLQQFSSRLAAAARMPLTRLMGQSPGGLGSNGSGEADNWNEQVEGYQEFQLKPRHEKMVEFAMAAKDGPTNGQILENWSVVYPPLKQMSEKERAETRKIVADTDNIYFQMGLAPELILLSRFGGEKYSAETQVDVGVLQELMKIESDAAIEKARNPPPPPDFRTQEQKDADNNTDHDDDDNTDHDDDDDDDNNTDHKDD